MKKMNNLLLLLPSMIFILFTVGFGTVNGLLQSIGYIPSLGMTDITFKYYKELFKSQDFLSSLMFTFKISLISSLLSLILGILLSYFILYRSASKDTNIILKIPVITPHLIGAFIIITLFSQSGILSRILFNLGIIKNQLSFPLLINDSNGIGIILTYLWKEVPFIALVMYNILANINKDLIMVGKTLGASNKDIFIKVLLPLCKKTLISSYIIIFAFSFGSFEVPFLVGPTSPKTLSVIGFLEYTSVDLFNRPYAMAINTFLSIISVILVGFYEYLFRKNLKEGF